jgi:hypothetical protein
MCQNLRFYMQILVSGKSGENEKFCVLKNASHTECVTHHTLIMHERHAWIVEALHKITMI